MELHQRIQQSKVNRDLVDVIAPRNDRAGSRESMSGFQTPTADSPERLKSSFSVSPDAFVSTQINV